MNPGEARRFWQVPKSGNKVHSICTWGRRLPPARGHPESGCRSKGTYSSTLARFPSACATGWCTQTTRYLRFTSSLQDLRGALRRRACTCVHASWPGTGVRFVLRSRQSCDIHAHIHGGIPPGACLPRGRLSRRAGDLFHASCQGCRSTWPDV